MGVGGVVKHTNLGILKTQFATLAEIPQFERIGRRRRAVHNGDVGAGLSDPHERIDADAGVALRFQMDQNTIVALKVARVLAVLSLPSIIIGIAVGLP